jgi:hypothetical protein
MGGTVDGKGQWGETGRREIQRSAKEFIFSA